MDKGIATTYLRAIKDGVWDTLSDRSRKEALDVAINALNANEDVDPCYLGGPCPYQIPFSEPHQMSD